MKLAILVMAKDVPAEGYNRRNCKWIMDDNELWERTFTSVEEAETFISNFIDTDLYDVGIYDMINDLWIEKKKNKHNIISYES